MQQAAVATKCRETWRSSLLWPFADLTDAQMSELNPIIRNAIYTVLNACEHHESEEWRDRYLEAQRRLIPGYWEEPELLDGRRDSRFRQLLDNMTSDQSDLNA